MNQFKEICGKPIGELNEIVKENIKTQDYNFDIMNEWFKKWRSEFTKAIAYE
jgi:hypothetical protein